MVNADPIFCCTSAVPLNTSISTDPHNDPNREVHDAIFKSFMAYAVRHHTGPSSLVQSSGLVSEPSANLPESSNSTSSPPQGIPAPVLTPEALQNNPITPNTPYVIHLISRHDFGPVISHRYFACPQSLQHDWIEVSQEQWFAAGEPFNLRAEQWDLKSLADNKFFRLTLRPNLTMRFHPTPEQAGGSSGR